MATNSSPSDHWPTAHDDTNKRLKRAKDKKDAGTAGPGEVGGGPESGPSRARRARIFVSDVVWS